MKRIFLFLSILAIHYINAQKQISLEDIWARRTFVANRMANLSAMQHTNQYTVLNYDQASQSQRIDLHDFTTLEKVKTIFDTSQTNVTIDAYSFSPDEKMLIIASNSEGIYRHSFVADYTLWDLQTLSKKVISDKKIQEPTFSPDGKKIAYAYANNLYIYELATEKTTQITFDGAKNKIINGVSDWVYEEEFSLVKMFDWNADGTKLAFVRFDETKVPEFSMDIYGNKLYPTQQVFKYPKAGEDNSSVSVLIYDLLTKNTKSTSVKSENNPNYYYIPRIKWTKNANLLSVQTLNRHQNNFNLNIIDYQALSVRSILNEKSNTYVDINDYLTFLDDQTFLFVSEKSGFNHIYQYDMNGKLKKQLTQGNWDITDFYGFDKKNKRIFYQSTENKSINRGIYSVSINGNDKKALSVSEGVNAAMFSPDFSLYINTHSSAKKPISYTLNQSNSGKIVKEILKNDELEKRFAEFSFPTKEFIEITNEKGAKLNAYIFKPADFQPTKKYPILLYQYSGPGSQSVRNEALNSNDFWHILLTQKGYIVACVDGRGTGFKGVDFKKCTYKELGKYEVEDQVFAARYFAKQPYIDAQRIGIWGWSFGGFMSSNCLFQASDVFKTAIAVAPVTNWRFYDSIYTERFMQTPSENPSGYDLNSPISHSQKLRGNYLLIHGTADDNVHVQNAMLLITKLIQENKNFDWLIYPDKDHSIYGGYTRLQLYTKMTDFILKNL